MPWCSVTGCSNNSKSSRLFRIPRAASNVERTNLWLYLINRPDLPLNAKICEKHFSETQFESARKDSRKLLKRESFPDLLISKNQYLDEYKFPITLYQQKVEIDADPIATYLEPKIKLEIVERTISETRQLDEYECKSPITLNQQNAKMDDGSLGISLEPEEEREINEIVDRSANNVEELKKTLKETLRKCRYYERRLQEKC